MSSIPLGLVMELVLFNFVVSGMNSGIEYILSKLSDDNK